MDFKINQILIFERNKLKSCMACKPHRTDVNALENGALPTANIGLVLRGTEMCIEEDFKGKIESLAQEL